METLEIQGKKYIKASSAARETGYTMDYIGQLCRKKKIDSVLVGRTWYVLQSAITDHRRTRGRSSAAKVHEHARKAIAESRTHEQRREPVRTTIAHAPLRYHPDGEELIPTLDAHKHQEQHPERHIAVRSKDTEVNIETNAHISLGVHAQSDESRLSPVKKTEQEIKWNGTIVVSPLEDDTKNTDGRDAESARIEAVSTDRSTRIAVRVEEEAPQITREALRGALEPTADSSGKDSSDDEGEHREAGAPSFVDRLNHAHVLNGPLLSPEIPEEEDAVTITEHEIQDARETHSHTGSGHTGHVWTYSMLGFVTVTCLLLAVTNIMVEQVIYIDSVPGTENSVRSMSRWYDLISLETAGNGATAILSSIRDMAQINIK